MDQGRQKGARYSMGLALALGASPLDTLRFHKNAAGVEVTATERDIQTRDTDEHPHTYFAIMRR
jgi:hypothetical protein